MRKTLISATTLSFALTASAFAADLPSRKEPAYIPPPPPPMWTGFYVGLNAGGFWDASNSVSTVTGNLFQNPSFVPNDGLATALAGTGVVGTSSAGFLGGGQLGYNYQFNNAFVVGLEADIQGIAGGSSSSSQLSGAPIIGSPGNSWLSTIQSSKSLDYLGTVRGRVGYLVTPTLLAYATGGLAYGGANTSTSIFEAVSLTTLGLAPPPIFGGSGSYSDTRVGWTVGGGVEWMFMPNWSAKLEYLYYDLGTATNNFSWSRALLAGGIGDANVSQSSTRFNGHVARAGVNYHFNWMAPAPVLAKY